MQVHYWSILWKNITDVHYEFALWMYIWAEVIGRHFALTSWPYIMDMHYECASWTYTMDVHYRRSFWTYIIDMHYWHILWTYIMNAHYIHFGQTSWSRFHVSIMCNGSLTLSFKLYTTHDKTVMSGIAVYIMFYCSNICTYSLVIAGSNCI